MRRILGALLVAVMVPAGTVSAAGRDEGIWEPKIPVQPLVWTSTALFSDGVGYLAAGEPHLYKTPDYGETWVPLPGPPTATSVLNLAFGSSDVGYANVGFALYRTMDGGSTWDQTAPLPLPRNARSHSLDAVAAIGGDRVMVSGWAWQGEECDPPRVDHFIWRSDDKGKTWSRANVGFPAAAWEIDLLNAREALVLLHGFETYTQGCSHAMFTNRSQVLLTRDGGRTFEEIHRGSFVDGDPVESVAMPASGRIVLGTRAGNILLSEDGGLRFRIVARAEDPAAPRPVDSIAFATGRVGYAGTNGGAIWRTRDGGRSWVLESLPVPLRIGDPSADARGKGSISAVGRHRAVAAGRGMLWQRTNAARR